ncbi:MAG: glycoside hydrolase family 25 protein [Rhizobiales bacterium]|nr:glycoside hydrolase family 25 protein [Hyphomicrobiales bacterium]
MRVTYIAALLFACPGLAGCAVSSRLEAADPQQSPVETTGSVARPVAAAPAAAAPAFSEERPTPVSMTTGTSYAPLPVSRPTQVAMNGAPAAIRRLAADAVEVHSRRFRDAKPINFGAASPRRLAVHGVDVSRWQGEIDWVKLRSQGANFAYIKATDGGDHLDPMFHRNWHAAEAAGLRRGAYHFFYWCRSASEQAAWFIRNVPRVEGALPPVIDVEWNGESRCTRRPSREQVLEKMRVFMERLEAHYGQRPIIYTAPDFYRDNLRGAFQDYPFWLRAVAQHPSRVYPGRNWVFWQYSGSGLSHGVTGRIDLNVFHGDENAWRTWLARSSRSARS